MNFTKSCDTRVYRHSSFPSHHQWFSPYRNNNIPHSQFHENQRRDQACLGGSLQTSLPSVGRMLNRFQVWCCVFNPSFLLAPGTRFCAFCSAGGSARLRDLCAGDPTACGCTGWGLTQTDIV